MQILNDKETVEICGGVAKSAIALGILAIGVLVTGILDGFFRPLKCN